MRYALLLILLLFAIPVLTKPGITTVTPSASVDVVATYFSGGTLVYNASITVANPPEGEPISQIPFALPPFLAKHLVLMYALYNNEIVIPREQPLGRGFLYGYIIDLPSPIDPNTTKTILLSLVFAEAALPTSDRIDIPVLRTPVLSIPINQTVVKVRLPSGSSVAQRPEDYNETSAGGRPEVSARFTEIQKAYYNFTDWVGVRNAGPFVRVESVCREVAFSQTGDLIVTDRYTVRNVGRDSFDQIHVTVPPYITFLEAFDDFGKLDTQNVTYHQSETSKIRVDLRFSVRGATSEGEFYERYSFSVRYKLDSTRYVSVDQNGATFTLQLDTLPPTAWVADVFSLKVILPKESYVVSASIHDIFGEQMLGYSIKNGQPVFTFLQYNMTCFCHSSFEITFKVSPFAAVTPIYGYCCAAVLLVLIMIYTIRKIPKPIKIEGPPSLLKFTEIYDERLDLLSEKASLMQKPGYLRDRKVTERLSAIDSKLKEQEEQLSKLAQQLREVSASLARAVENITLEEQRLQVLEQERRTLEEMRLRREIESRAYERLLEDVNKRISKAIGRIRFSIRLIKEEWL